MNIPNEADGALTYGVMRQCTRRACNFRFPGPNIVSFPCPKCGAATTAVATTYITEKTLLRDPGSPRHVEVALDNLRSAYNVGSIFRTSDGAGVAAIHLFGISPPPTQPQVAKTALGSDISIPWVQHWDGLSAIRTKKDEGYLIWSLEKHISSVDLFSTADLPLNRNLLLVVGNEKSGVDPDILAESDCIVHLPMAGHKESLNVASAFAIAIYTIMFGLKRDSGV